MTELRYLGFMCRARVGHFDASGELVDQETSQVEVPLITVAQFKAAIDEVKAELEQRNAAQPNRAQRRSSSRGRKKAS